jgi:AcrR family transcriptional regulator
MRDTLSQWPEVLEAARRMADRGDWQGATMDEIAREAGIARATLYRRGATRELIVAALREELAREERDALWPVVSAPGSGRERLEAALRVYCSLAERSLGLFEPGRDALVDDVYHAGGGEALTRPEFTDPLRLLLREGGADGSLRQVDDVDETATVVYNTVGWIYQHLRRGHRWPPGRAADAVVTLVLHGLVA